MIKNNTYLVLKVLLFTRIKASPYVSELKNSYIEPKFASALRMLEMNLFHTPLNIKESIFSNFYISKSIFEKKFILPNLDRLKVKNLR